MSPMTAQPERQATYKGDRHTQVQRIPREMHTAALARIKKKNYANMTDYINDLIAQDLGMADFRVERVKVSRRKTPAARPVEPLTEGDIPIAA